MPEETNQEKSYHSKGNEWFMEPGTWAYAHLFEKGTDIAICGQSMMYLVSISPPELKPMIHTTKPVNLCYDCVYPPAERREEYKRRCEVVFTQTGGGE